MRWGRLVALLSIALLCAVAETLVRHPDPSVGFQAWMVLQLLAVIVAAIGVAAVASVVGLMLLRVLISPLQDLPSTFVAWSFLRAQTIDEPIPLRVGRWLRREVGAEPLQPREVSGLALCGGGFVALCGAAVIALALHQVMLAGGSLTGAKAIVSRMVALALLLHGALLVSESLPWRRSRLVLPTMSMLAIAAVPILAAFHPLAAPYVHGPALSVAMVLAAAIATWVVTRPRHRRLRAVRGRLGQMLWLVLIALILVIPLAGQWAMGLAVQTAAVVAVVLVLYLLAQAQPKVTLPVFVSIVGVAAGTWALIVVLSVMGGFAADLRAKMLIANAHALVERPGRGKPLADWRAVATALRAVEGVVAVSPQVRGDAILSSTFNVNNFVSLRGIDPTLPEVQRELGGTLVTGSLALLEAPDRLGRDAWRARRPEDIADDLPPVAVAVEATNASIEPVDATTEGGDDELEAILQLAPGPGEISPPSDAPPRPPIAHTSDGAQLDSLSGVDDVGDNEANEEAPAQRLPATMEDLPWPSGRADVMAPIAPGVVLGAELARSLQVDLGDRVEVITPDADVGPTGMRPRVRTFRVAGTIETGLYDVDSKVAYVSLTAASRYFNLEGAANVIELRLQDPSEPDAVIAAVRSTLQSAGAPSDTEVLDWRALNRSLFSALAFERLVIFLVLALIILVASFAIISALTMVILQKRNGIAMLQAMGASRAEVRAAFVQMGGVIGSIGTIAGLILGLSTCLLIDKLGIQLPEAYYVRTLPVAIEPAEVAAVVVASLLISLVATVFPAKSAARLSPLEGLRYE